MLIYIQDTKDIQIKYYLPELSCIILSRNAGTEVADRIIYVQFLLF